jgi:hypothetical protein
MLLCLLGHFLAVFHFRFVSIDQEFQMLVEHKNLMVEVNTDFHQTTGVEVTIVAWTADLTGPMQWDHVTSI